MDGVRSFAAEKDNRINRQLHEAGLLQGVLESHKDFVLEGGSIESDGERTLFTTTSCLMAPHRNQPLTQEDIDKQLQPILPKCRESYMVRLWSVSRR